MNPILILRTEIVCLILLIYLAFISRTFRMGKDGKTFNLIMSFSMMHVVMDAVTVWTVNHLAETPAWLNDTAHILFYLSAVLFSAEILHYVATLSYPRAARKISTVSLALTGIYLILTVTGVLSIRYEAFNGTNASTGGAPTAGFVLCSLFFTVSIFLIFAARKRIGKHIRMLLLPMLFLLIAAELVQMFVKEFLFTGATVTVITVGFFFSLENPAALLEKKIMLDALSGVGSRSSYERDMVDYEAEFQKDKSIPFTFIFIDINNLRSINGLYGHMEGDALIGRIAALLMNNLRGTEHLYRMSGDEFLAVYRRTDEKGVVRDIQRVQDACMRADDIHGYHPELAIGYAVSDIKYNSLRDVLRVADYMMYRNKTALKREVAVGAMHETGTRLNLFGLTDRVFDAMCQTSEEYYPFITNMETNVTRVAPGMSDFFGLSGEFIQDFLEVWAEKMHPADRDGAIQDIRATLRGAKNYHYYRYRAKGGDGNYAEITCRGGVYHGRDGEPDIFCGYMVNHGAPQMRDPSTGLKNERALIDRVTDIVANGEKATIMRLEIRNLNRATMLYGNGAMDSLIHSVAGICQRAAKDHGEVYAGTEKSFVFCLDGNDKGAAREVFDQIHGACAGGVLAEHQVIPLSVFAGAVPLPSENLRKLEDIRAAVLYIAEEAGLSGADTLMFIGEDTSEIRQQDAPLLREIHRDCLINRSRFYIRLQPIIDSATGRVVCAEALLRYREAGGNEVPPGRFISFLESDPGYKELGYDILRNSLRHAAEIRRTLPEFNINVNITAPQLYTEDFIDRVKKILEEENYPADHLILELTERCKEMEFTFLKKRVEDLRNAGLRVALDDMGTGFSSIDLLLHLDVNEIKLDMAFTAQMEENENDARFAEMLAHLTAENNMLLCFEGVETEEKVKYLKRFGKVLLQGYYFDRPLMPEDFIKKYCGEDRTQPD